MRLYTMANDRMADAFSRFLEYRSVFLPDVPLHVIPFNDELERVSALAGEHPAVTLLAPDPRIDETGKVVFQDEDYRPGIPAWRYFRKLNMFVGHDEPALFMDANAMLLADPRGLVDFSALDRQTIWFRARSASNRTIINATATDFLNMLGPKLGQGYNCGMFVARGGFLDPDLALAVAQRRLRRFIGAAPEQGFLAIYIGLFGKTAQLFRQVNAEIGARQSTETELDDDGRFLRYAGGRDAGKICIALKQTGQDISSEPETIRAFFARHKAAIPA